MTSKPNDVNKWLVALSVILPTFMEVVDTSIASVALPHIAGSISASTDEATWVLTSYLAANAVVLPASSWFALRFGRKRFLMACIVIFTISSFLCGSATSLAMIVLARAVQGAGGGALQPLSQAILLESFPPEERGLAMSVFGLGVVVAPVVGPTLGGLLTDSYSWRWAFYINIPIGIIALFMISRFVSDPDYVRNAKPGRFDSIGFGLLAVGLGSLQLVLDKGQEADWFGAVWIRWASILMFVALAAFVARQLIVKNPVVRLTVFQDRNFAVGCLLIALFGGAIYGIITLLPLFYQTLMGYTAAAAGVAVSPRGLGALLIMPVVGLLTSRLDNRWLIATGFMTFAWASLRFSGLTQDISQWSLLWPIIISGVAAGMVFVPLTTVTMGTLSNEQIGNASGLFNLFRNIGGSVGISLVNTMIFRHQQLRQSELVQHMNPSNLSFRVALQQTEHLASAAAGPGTAQHRAYAMIAATVGKQAAILSYIDVFRFLALVTLACVPLVFFLKKVKARKGVSAAH